MSMYNIPHVNAHAFLLMAECFAIAGNLWVPAFGHTQVLNYTMFTPEVICWKLVFELYGTDQYHGLANVHMCMLSRMCLTPMRATTYPQTVESVYSNIFTSNKDIYLHFTQRRCLQRLAHAG